MEDEPQQKLLEETLHSDQNISESATTRNLKNITSKFGSETKLISSVHSQMKLKEPKLVMPSLKNINWKENLTFPTTEEEKKRAMKNLLLKKYQPTLEELIQKAVATRMAAEFNQLLIDTIIGKKS